MRALIVGLLAAAVGLSGAAAQEPAPARGKDRRLSPPVDYNGYFPWTPPASKAAWEARRKVVREQVLVATGLWPMPEKIPLEPTIHGKIARDGYTVEKVFFASLPGHYVTGNLYRPAGKAGKLPGVLCPHGHWPNGRFHAASDAEVQRDLKSGAEQTPESARYPLQARCAQLARLGCVVFHYDMVGYADSQQIPHREGFKDVDAQLRLHTFLGLQTFNSVRALDFLTSLPDVDPARIGVTGASGGGTQTFLLGAVDDRVTAAFPAVMVSTAMQGGCVCENSAYLRVGTGNIELTALFAPRPVAMAAALDWTRDIETKGLPELKALYRLYGAEDNVLARAYLQFGHNYNQVSRELMYGWFNKHLKLGHATPIKEQPFRPVPPKELSVYDKEHPLPADAVDAAGLRRYLTARDEAQLKRLLPRDAAGLEKLRATLGPALRTMMADALPGADQVELTPAGTETVDGVRVQRGTASRKGAGEVVPVAVLSPPGERGAGQLVVWVHPAGLDSVIRDGKLTPAARAVIDGGHRILAVEVFRTGATAKVPRPTTNMKTGSIVYAGYYYGYNRSLVADRVRDILTAVALARATPGVKAVHLAGFDAAGPWVALARGLCGDAVGRTAADLNGFRFEQVKDFDHEMMLPGALKYGGLPALAALAAPHELYLHNVRGAGPATLLEAAYRAAGQPARLVRQDARQDAGEVIQWLFR